MDDEARYYIIKMILAYYEKVGFIRMLWPAQSPDLNPIKNIWRLMKIRISKRRYFIQPITEIECVLREE
jgi:hypothetical protein